jgi:hypothetical protein
MTSGSEPPLATSTAVVLVLQEAGMSAAEFSVEARLSGVTSGPRSNGKKEARASKACDGHSKQADMASLHTPARQPNGMLV